MRKQAKNLLLLLLLPLLCSCPGGDEPMPETAYSPILMSRQQLETSILRKEPRTIANPGKIYRYGHYILINEPYKGVHIINNQNPKAPVNIAFIQVPGCVDMALKDNVLYVDNAVDLVAIKLSDFNSIEVAKRVRGALPPLLPPDNLGVAYSMAGAPEDAVIVGWELRKGE
ncbi:hypothetical protein C8N40_10366 [Pontibacter mucosus]|uniref:LVIVD repeat-containing protein n=1 Tax=Pontibacter mucosus TaxID=1649266 RepID=A0A2T5YL24_9BACT|nr:hypothetical protein [Pontibacter mucosus]PTX19994.1 hypothetical protein C8N40_10366 [Pontibacter mucosus]